MRETPVPATPAPTAGPPTVTAGISPEQLQALNDARQRSRKIDRAAGVAAFSGWTLAVFAGLALISGLFNLRALVLGIGLAAVAFVELRGAKGLRAIDLAAPGRLALNQVGLVVMITIYAGWGIAEALLGPGAYDAEIAAGGPGAGTFESIDQLTRLVTVAVGVMLIVGSVIAQACTAWYYFSRRKHMVSYLRATPDWVVETLRH